MKKIVIACVAFLALSACERPSLKAQRYTKGYAKVLTTDDGVTLYYTYINGHYVYFSSNGTSRQTGCGKNCTRPDTVPNAQ